MVGLLDFILVLLQLGGISLLQSLLRQLLFMLLQKSVELLTEKKIECYKLIGKTCVDKLTPLREKLKQK